jgi:hypothetical protein
MESSIRIRREAVFYFKMGIGKRLSCRSHGAALPPISVFSICLGIARRRDTGVAIQMKTEFS